MRSCPFAGRAMANNPQRNFILSRLAPADFKLLEPHLAPVDLPVRKMLEHRDRRINNIYFPESGFASVVANGDIRPIEVGIIGREGMTGLAVVLGGDRNSHETFVQAAGHGQCMRARLLRDAIRRARACNFPCCDTCSIFWIRLRRQQFQTGEAVSRSA